MKKLLIIILLLMPILTMAQEIKFMGIKIDSKVDYFAQQLKAKGLKQTIDRFEEKQFKGTFATYNNCTIIVTGTEVNRMVKSIEIQFEDVRNKEYERDKVFDNLLVQYKNKYGSKVKLKPMPDDDNILNYTSYIIKDGDVEIDITKCGPAKVSFLGTDCFVNIMYWNLKQKNIEETNPQKYSNDI